MTAPAGALNGCLLPSLVDVLLGRGQALGQRLLGQLLDVEVDGQLHVVALHRRLRAEDAEHPALRVDLELGDPGLAAQGVLVGRLDAGLADLVARLVALLLAGGQFLVVDLADVADDVGGHACRTGRSARRWQWPRHRETRPGARWM